MNNKYITILKDIIREKIDEKKITVFLFGSRARNENSKNSDIDIGLLSDREIDQKTIRELKESVEDSIVPYHVDFIDFFNVSKEFESVALQKIELWNKGKYFKKNYNFSVEH